MGVYKTAEELYTYMGKIFQAGFDDPELGDRFRAVGATIRLNYRDPDSKITIDFGQGLVEFGDSTTLEPEVNLFMDADLAHRFWLGKVNVPVAMAKGQIKTKGPVGVVLKITPITKPLYEKYKDILRESGREELLTV